MFEIMKGLELFDNEKSLLKEIKDLIEATKKEVNYTVNSALVLLNWRIGARINNEILNNEKAEYGLEIVKKLSNQLINEYGRGFSRDNLFRMMRFVKAFPSQKIVATLSQPSDGDKGNGE
jgi:hypothetical protein